MGIVSKLSRIAQVVCLSVVAILCGPSTAADNPPPNDAQATLIAAAKVRVKRAEHELRAANAELKRVSKPVRPGDPPVTSKSFVCKPEGAQCFAPEDCCSGYCAGGGPGQCVDD